MADWWSNDPLVQVGTKAAQVVAERRGIEHDLLPVRDTDALADCRRDLIPVATEEDIGTRRSGFEQLAGEPECGTHDRRGDRVG